MTVGQNIHRAREQRKLTQEQLAGLVGKKRATITRYELDATSHEYPRRRRNGLSTI